VSTFETWWEQFSKKYAILIEVLSADGRERELMRVCENAYQNGYRDALLALKEADAPEGTEA
jgi:hypothetical protein